MLYVMGSVREIIAENVKRLRKGKHTQASLAEAADVSVSFVAQVEGQQSGLSEDTIERFATALGVHPSELFRSSEPPIGPKAELLRLVDELDENALETITNVLRAMARNPSQKTKVK